MNTDQLIERLHDPSSYPHPVDSITTIETHISIVFLTGEFAYKLKKPVDFGFLDFTHIENRKKYCQLEVQLNQRTAPQLYIGTYAVNAQNDGSISLSALDANNSAAHSAESAETIDYLVKMKQFNPNDLLSKTVEQRDTIDFPIIEELAYQIAAFHKIADRVELSSHLGEPATQLKPMLDNFPTLYELFTDKETIEQLDRLQHWTKQSHQALTDFIISRKQDGFIKACHGDLHLENIALIDHKPVLFDGIEFNDEFRWIDVLSDLSFLLIDLDFRNQRSASNLVLSLYLSKTLDYSGLPLLNFYRVYRSLVRAKINSLRAQQLNPDSNEYKQVKQIAFNYLQQASQYSRATKQNHCILLQGVSGSGKSHFAQQMLQQLPLNAIVISSDRIRKSLFGIEATERVSQQQQKQLYSVEMNKRTYAAMLEYAQTALKAGFNVIVDATFLKLEHRAPFYKMAKELNVNPHLISLKVTPEFAKKAIASRQQENRNPSDANVDVMLNQINYMQAPTQSENALVLNSEMLRQKFPIESLKEFLKLPITEL